jgi:hypothetical protein
MERELIDLARRYFWWQPPEQAMSDRTRFLCQLMQLGIDADVRVARRLLGDDALREVVRNAPAGVLDARSWNFWHLILFGAPPPPLPTRPLPP